MHHLTPDAAGRGSGGGGGGGGGGPHSYRGSYMGIIKLLGRQLHRRLDLKSYAPADFAFGLLYFTGSDHFNRSMRAYAKNLGYTLSDRGLAHAITLPSKERLRGKTNLVAAECEGDIFDALGLEWREPWERDCVVAPLDPTRRIGCAADNGADAQPDSTRVAPASLRSADECSE